jgi:hypothetical protein
LDASDNDQIIASFFPLFLEKSGAKNRRWLAVAYASQLEKPESTNSSPRPREARQTVCFRTGFSHWMRDGTCQRRPKRF